MRSELECRYYDTVLPPRALFDKDFFEVIFDIKKLEPFLRSCNVKDSARLSSTIDTNIRNKGEDGLYYAEKLLKHLWYNKKENDKLVEKYDT